MHAKPNMLNEWKCIRCVMSNYKFNKRAMIMSHIWLVVHRILPTNGGPRMHLSDWENWRSDRSDTEINNVTREIAVCDL